MIIVIRAGGTGTRLWPVSRRNQPKQFQKIVSAKTMCADTFDRAMALIDGDTEKIFVSCNEAHVALTRAQMPMVREDHLIIEPMSKNTGPAMCLEVAVLATRVPEDEIILSIPSDDVVGNVPHFVAAMKEVSQVLRANPEWIYTPCAPADVVDTGYCYVLPGDEITMLSHGALATVGTWIEKPNAVVCKELVEDGRHAIHTGMYMYALGTLRQLFAELHPQLTESCDALALDMPGNREAYGAVASESIETLITRQAPNVAMSVVPELTWSDVGKWSAVKRVLGGSGANVLRGNVLTRDTTASLVYAPKEKQVAVIGLNNVVVIDTGDALLVASADKSHEIKELLPKIDGHYL